MGELHQICTVPSVTLFNFSCSLGPATWIVTLQDQKFLKIHQNDTTFTYQLHTIYLNHLCNMRKCAKIFHFFGKIKKKDNFTVKFLFAELNWVKFCYWSVISRDYGFFQATKQNHKRPICNFIAFFVKSQFWKQILSRPSQILIRADWKWEIYFSFWFYYLLYLRQKLRPIFY